MYVPAAKREYGYYVLPILAATGSSAGSSPSTTAKTGDAPRERRLVGARRAAVSLDQPLREPRRAGSELRIERRWTSRPARSTRARSRTRRPARSPSRSTRPPPTSRRRSASTRATTTRAPRTRRGARSRLCLASLESAEYGFAFSSGMGATTTIMHLVSPGDRIVAVNDVYGGTYRLFSKVYEPKGYEFEFAAARRDRRGDRRAHAPRLARDADEPAAEHRRHRARSPTRRTRPARWSSSTTPSRRRTSSGRSSSAPTSSSTRRRSTSAATPTSSAASPATNDPTIAERLAFLQNSLGAVPGPFDSWLVLRGLKTLALRMQRALRERARGRRVPRRPPAVERVLYPGLAGPSRATSSPRGRCPTSAGWSRSSPRAPRRRSRSSRRTKIWKLAESLGGVESLIEVPVDDDARLDRGRAVRRARRTSSASRSGSSRPTTSSPTSRRRSSRARRAGA